MRCIVVTLDVTKLNGWLKAVAYCPAERRRGGSARLPGEAGGGRGRVGAAVAQAAHRAGLD